MHAPGAIAILPQNAYSAGSLHEPPHLGALDGYLDIWNLCSGPFPASHAHIHPKLQQSREAFWSHVWLMLVAQHTELQSLMVYRYRLSCDGLGIWTRSFLGKGQHTALVLLHVHLFLHQRRHTAHLELVLALECTRVGLQCQGPLHTTLQTLQV